MITGISAAAAVTATAAAVLWAALFIWGHNRYNSIISNKAIKEFRMSCVFFIGFGLMKLIKTDINSMAFRARKNRNAQLYSTEYAEFYTYVITGAQFTYFLTLLPMGLSIGALSGEPLVIMAAVLSSLLMLVFLDFEVRKKVNEKSEDIMCELPDVISRLTLLVNAGMVLRDAWTAVAYSSHESLYKEMQKVSSDLKNGISESDALSAFAYRCQISQIRKFSNTLAQNIQKGNSELVSSLIQLADELWEDKKNIVKKKGEAVNQKLLFPMLLIFVAIIIMIIVPVFSNIN
ncbi:MAG: type II secretion system F family protein [Oscillospiraceae bacterium]|nr:type II secretion system F family protein [Oscillospiraceae bacterium]